MTLLPVHALASETAAPRMDSTHLGPGRLPFWVMLYFLTIALPVHFNLGSVFMTGTRVILLIVIIPLTIRLFSGRIGPVMPTDILLLGYSAWSIATLFINSPAQAVSFGGSYVLEVYASYLLARAYIRTPEQFRAMCRGFFTLLLFTLPFAIYETQTGQAPIPKLINSLPGVYSYGDYYNYLAGKRLGLERAQVIFAHPIHYGVFCASLISLAFVGYKYILPAFWRLLITFLICVGVICSVSSGAIMPTILQFGLIFWAWMFKAFKFRWIILSGLVTILYIVVDVLSNRTPIEVFLEYGTLSPETAYGRKLIFDWGMINVWKHPFIGIGMNEWERPWWKSASMDNFWLLSTVRYGIPGFLLLAVAYFLPVWKSGRRSFAVGGSVWQFRRAWVMMQISLILTLCTVDVWEVILTLVFFLLGAGVWFISFQPVTEPLRPITEVASVRSAEVRYTRFSNRKARRETFQAVELEK
jgi:hypothetical protein